MIPEMLLRVSPEAVDCPVSVVERSSRAVTSLLSALVRAVRSLPISPPTVESVTPLGSVTPMTDVESSCLAVASAESAAALATASSRMAACDAAGALRPIEIQSMSNVSELVPRRSWMLRIVPPVQSAMPSTSKSTIVVAPTPIPGSAIVFSYDAENPWPDVFHRSLPTQPVPATRLKRTFTMRYEAPLKPGLKSADRLIEGSEPVGVSVM